jgi:hypothetical protein
MIVKWDTSCRVTHVSAAQQIVRVVLLLLIVCNVTTDTINNIQMFQHVVRVPKGVHNVTRSKYVCNVILGFIEMVMDALNVRCHVKPVPQSITA